MNWNWKQLEGWGWRDPSPSPLKALYLIKISLIFSSPKLTSIWWRKEDKRHEDMGTEEKEKGKRTGQDKTAFQSSLWAELKQRRGEKGGEEELSSLSLEGLP